MKWYAALAAACVVCVGTLFAAESVPVKKKILVVYYSRSGNTERVASDLAGRLGCDMEKLIDTKDRAGMFGAIGAGKDASFGKMTVLQPTEKDPRQYDLVIVGTPIWTGNISSAIRTYIAQNKGTFKHYAFFSTSRGAQPPLFVERIEKAVGSAAIAYTGFSTKDLKSSEVYEQKLADFISQVK